MWENGHGPANIPNPKLLTDQQLQQLLSQFPPIVAPKKKPQGGSGYINERTTMGAVLDYVYSLYLIVLRYRHEIPNFQFLTTAFLKQLDHNKVDQLKNYYLQQIAILQNKYPNDDFSVKLGSGKTKSSNSWIDHVRAYRQSHPGISYMDALKQAKSSYNN